MNTIHKTIIIGSGPAGLTAGIYSSRSDLEPIIIEGKNPGGQLMGTSYVENWPGEKKILGPELMQKMREQAKELGCEFLSGEVVKVDFSQRPFTVWTDNDKEIKTHSVIIATGAKSKRLDVSGEQKYWGKGVTTCAVCDGAFYKDKPVVIVGGGDTAMEDASFMTKFTDKITVVQILDHLTASPAMKERVIDNPDIDVLYKSTIAEIRGDDEQVTEVVVTNQETGEITTLPANAVFIAIGMKPNTEPFKGQMDMGEYSYIEVEHPTTKTSVDGVFAAGDVADYRYKQAVTSSGEGCKAALDAQRYLETVL